MEEYRDQKRGRLVFGKLVDSTTHHPRGLQMARPTRPAWRCGLMLHAILCLALSAGFALTGASLAAQTAVKPKSPTGKLVKKAVAAIASNDEAKVEALMSKVTLDELKGIHKTSLRRLHKKLDAADLNLSKAKIEKMEMQKGMMIWAVDVTMKQGERRFRFLINLMAPPGSKPSLLGHSEWIKELEKPPPATQ
jgi:hypothetical protein